MLTPHRTEATGLEWLVRGCVIGKVVATPVVRSPLQEVIAGTAMWMPRATAATCVAEVKMAAEKRVAVTGLSAEEVRAEAKPEEAVTLQQVISPADATREAPLRRIARTVDSYYGCCRRTPQEEARTTAWAAVEIKMPVAAAVRLTTAEGPPADPPRGQRPSARSIP